MNVDVTSVDIHLPMQVLVSAIWEPESYSVPYCGPSKFLYNGRRSVLYLRDTALFSYATVR